jgi:hypothetical protein
MKQPKKGRALSPKCLKYVLSKRNEKKKRRERMQGERFEKYIDLLFLKIFSCQAILLEDVSNIQSLALKKTIL